MHLKIFGLCLLIYTLSTFIGMFWINFICKPVAWFTDYVPFEWGGIGQWILDTAEDYEIPIYIFWPIFFIIWLIELIIAIPWIILCLPSSLDNPLCNVYKLKHKGV